MTAVAAALPPSPARPTARGHRLELVHGAAGPGAADARGGWLPASLAARYGGGALTIPLRRDRPTVVANFVSTLDGVVALAADGSTGGGEISGFFEPDRFVMGLLRGLADAVLVGAGTVRAAPDHRWIPGHVLPRGAEAVAAWRRELGLEPVPTTIVVTASGRVPDGHPGLTDPAIPVTFVTTGEGAARLADQGLAPRTRLHVAADTEAVTSADVLAAAAASGARLVLCEGGPHLFGELLADRAVDELFLTLSPQLAGRDGPDSRLALVEGTAFPPADGRWARLVSVHAADDHLFLRYALGHDEETR